MVCRCLNGQGQGDITYKNKETGTSDITRRKLGKVLLHCICTQRNVFWILLNHPEIRLYSPCNDWFGTANGRSFGSKSIEENSTIWFGFDLIRFRKDFSVSIRVMILGEIWESEAVKGLPSRAWLVKLPALLAANS